jgi:hypothetical protein
MGKKECKILKIHWYHLSIVLFCLFVIANIYDYFAQYEETTVSIIIPSLSNFAYWGAYYLHEVPNPKQNVNLIEELTYYIISDRESLYLPMVQSGQFGFYVVGNDAWVGFELPKTFLTKEHNKSREKLKNYRSIPRSVPIYGSDSLNFPPPCDSMKYRYQEKDNVVWIKVKKQ